MGMGCEGEERRGKGERKGGRGAARVSKRGKGE
jgi:hypothetical protein